MIGDQIKHHHCIVHLFKCLSVLLQIMGHYVRHAKHIYDEKVNCAKIRNEYIWWKGKSAVLFLTIIQMTKD